VLPPGISNYPRAGAFLLVTTVESARPVDPQRQGEFPAAAEYAAHAKITTVRLRGADTEGSIQATDEPVIVARVTVRAAGTGTTTLTPTGQFDSDEGTRLGVESDAGSVRVADETATASATPSPTTSATPSPTASTTPSPTASTTDGATTEESGGETTDSSGEETAASGPGLGVVGSLLALVTVAGLRRRR